MRKKKDNPYTLNYMNEEDNYVVLFKDSKGIFQSVNVSEDVFKTMDRFELDDLSEMNEYDNHIEHSEIYEFNINIRSTHKQELLEDYIVRKSSYEDLMNAINLLPEIQKRRIKKYYFDNKNEYVIAREENASQQAVNKSLRQAIQKLKQILKN